RGETECQQRLSVELPPVAGRTREYPLGQLLRRARAAVGSYTNSVHPELGPIKTKNLRQSTRDDQELIARLGIDERRLVAFGFGEAERRTADTQLRYFQGARPSPADREVTRE